MARRLPAPPSHPGSLIEDEILRLLGGDEIALKVGATALGVPVDQLLALVRGKTGITPVWALRLARVIGRTPAEWMELQAVYDLWKAEQVLGPKLAELKPLRKR